MTNLTVVRPYEGNCWLKFKYHKANWKMYNKRLIELTDLHESITSNNKGAKVEEFVKSVAVATVKTKARK